MERMREDENTEPPRGKVWLHRRGAKLTFGNIASKQDSFFQDADEGSLMDAGMDMVTIDKAERESLSLIATNLRRN